MKHLLITAAALAALAAPAASFAGTSAPTEVRVGYGDLNLDAPRDASIMLQRLDDAALQACGVFGGSLREYRQAVEGSACYRQGLAQAVRALDAPAVTSLYDHHVGEFAASTRTRF